MLAPSHPLAPASQVRGQLSNSDEKQGKNNSDVKMPPKLTSSEKGGRVPTGREDGLLELALLLAAPGKLKWDSCPCWNQHSELGSPLKIARCLAEPLEK